MRIKLPSGDELARGSFILPINPLFTGNTGFFGQGVAASVAFSTIFAGCCPGCTPPIAHRLTSRNPGNAVIHGGAYVGMTHKQLPGWRVLPFRPSGAESPPQVMGTSKLPSAYSPQPSRESAAIALHPGAYLMQAVTSSPVSQEAVSRGTRFAGRIRNKIS